MKKRQVLFLCTGNSCRSHMAEGMVNHFWGGRWTAFSAGTVPSGYVHPLAIQVMAEWGIDISGHESKTAVCFRDKQFDLVVTVCDDAAQNCPVWLGKDKKVHIGFPDPALATGTEEEKTAVFRQVRDDIQAKLTSWVFGLPMEEVR